MDKSKLIDIPTYDDKRGSLASLEFEKEIGFVAHRIVHVFDVKDDRGGHAHRFANQILMAPFGSFHVKVFNGISWNTYILDNPRLALFTPRLTFLKMCNFSRNAVCTVLSDTYYVAEDSIRNLEDYIMEIER